MFCLTTLSLVISWKTNGYARELGGARAGRLRRLHAANTPGRARPTGGRRAAVSHHYGLMMPVMNGWPSAKRRPPNRACQEARRVVTRPAPARHPGLMAERAVETVDSRLTRNDYASAELLSRGFALGLPNAPRAPLRRAIRSSGYCRSFATPVSRVAVCVKRSTGGPYRANAFSRPASRPGAKPRGRTPASLNCERRVTRRLTGSSHKDRRELSHRQRDSAVQYPRTRRDA